MRHFPIEINVYDDEIVVCCTTPGCCTHQHTSCNGRGHLVADSTEKGLLQVNDAIENILLRMDSKKIKK